MKNRKSSNFFWTSFTDLMTSLFFIMLVLFVLSFVRQQIQIKDLKKKIEVYDRVEKNLNPLKNNNNIFKYDSIYKRFTLRFDVQFRLSKFNINEEDLQDYESTIYKIDEAGRELKRVIDSLKKQQAQERYRRLKNVSYLLVISGTASDQGFKSREKKDYLLSYQRAWSLWKRWRTIGINFEEKGYNELVDLQISGNGWGGVGREEKESKNQRFIIQIIPKIGNIEANVARAKK